MVYVLLVYIVILLPFNYLKLYVVIHVDIRIKYSDYCIMGKHFSLVGDIFYLTLTCSVGTLIFRYI